MSAKLKTVQFNGHSAVFLGGDDFLVAVDPWLEGNPLCPESSKEPSRLDVIILTHAHADHAGDAVRLAKRYGSKVAATYELGSILMEEGIPAAQVVQMNKGGTVEISGIHVTLTHAMHSNGYESGRGILYAGEACGAVIRDESTSLYHAGDTALFSDMALIKDSYAPAAAFLPIGDRFTMGPREAATAAKLLGVKTAVPIHHSTFPLLTGTPKEFAECCSALGVRTAVIEPGQTMELARLTR